MPTRLIDALLTAANADNTKAQYLIGLCLYRGRGINQTVPGALQWLFRASAKGHMKSAYAIMRIHRDEYHDPVELEKAVHSANRAEEVTFPEHPNLIAEYPNKQQQTRVCQILFAEGQAMYNGGDFSEAARFFLTAAKYGYKVAQSRIAGMYKAGQGVPANSGAALYWSETAKSERPLL